MRTILTVLIAILFLAACGPAPTPTTALSPAAPPRVATLAPASDEEAILQLLTAEGEALVAADIDRLMGLWAEDAVVRDARHTPDDPSDDWVWEGRDAIRQRYVNLVLPGNPQEAGAVDVNLTIEGDRATAISTTRIGSEVSPGGDRWTFRRINGTWKIESLTYNLEQR